MISKGGTESVEKKCLLERLRLSCEMQVKNLIFNAKISIFQEDEYIL